MTDHAELDAALERVIAAAREHLSAVKAADGRVDDDEVWRAYVELNNASYEYDELLLDAFGEVTPWDVESIDPDEVDEHLGAGLGGLDGGEPTDPYPQVVSVRQRRDYRVPSVAALIKVADVARRETAEESGALTEPEPVTSVGEAVLELLQAGDGSLGALDIPELDPLDGVVTVAEVVSPLDLSELAEDDAAGPFVLGPEDRLVGRLDEHAYLDVDLDDELAEEFEDDDEDSDGPAAR
jgi:hypothetical protein